jgi:2-alkyl-3-oxoalkanoate reductase
MKILVTGASGFIGGKIVENLAKNTEYDVLATGRSSSTAKFGNYPNVTYFTQDLKNNLPFLSCDVCIHCAGLADDRSSDEQLTTNNVDATANLLAALEGCNLLIFISSASVYDFSDGVPKREEDADTNIPVSSYGKSKLAAEKLVIDAKVKSVYIIRPRAVYGPGDRVLLPRILRLIKGSSMIVPANLSKRTSLTHIENLYEAVHNALLQANPGTHIFNIADNATYDLNAVFGEILEKKAGKKLLIRIPAILIKALLIVNGLLGRKGQFTRQSYTYITEHSQLSIEKAQTHLRYTGSHKFYKSINELEV